jgi:arylsulfatase A-like enzyme
VNIERGLINLIMTTSLKKILRKSSIISSMVLTCGAIGLAETSGSSPEKEGKTEPSHPNILIIMVDQMQTPPEGYGPDEGVVQGLKEIFGFRPLTPDNEYTRFFPGLMRLRQNAVVFGKHYTASAACTPSRACILTGQYPVITGVDQTASLFTSDHDWTGLDPDGVPTIGDWFRAAGYTTHYFGKWHVSEVSGETKSLEPWGFSDYETSYPEPHGPNPENLGAFRDVVFADEVVKFLEKKGNDISGEPWLAVGSLVNPHDVCMWPVTWQTPPSPGIGVVPWSDFPPPPSIPSMGQKSRMITIGEKTFQVDLNPDGFPQENSSLPRTYYESLDSKPRCQKEIAYKWGLGIGSNLNLAFKLGNWGINSPLPFQLQGEYASAWSLHFNQFYTYCHYLTDFQIKRILQALDDNNLSDNTIVVFLSDHGEMAGAHGGMIQKWHNAYEESIRVPMVISSPLVNKNKEQMKVIQQPTSSIDLAPTLISLAGFDENKLQTKMKEIHGKAVVRPFVGADLSSLLKDTQKGNIPGPDGTPRTGVLFMSSDMITEPGPHMDDSYKALYQAFLDNVEKRISAGIPLSPGSVLQPNNVQAFCTGDWKIVRYFDPKGIEKDEWELYCLTTDPVEQINLVNFRTGEVREDVSVPGLTAEELKTKNAWLKTELAKQEAIVTQAVQSPVASAQLLLLQNYPNPFNQKTTIPFYVPDPGVVRLSVMNVNSKEVLLLLNEKLAAGNHIYEFHVGGIPAGIYFVRLTSGSSVVVKKMILTVQR